MSTSDIKIIRRGYGIATIFCLVFAGIYEYFSHGVYSKYMIFAFLFPMIGGIVASLLEFVHNPARKVFIRPVEIYTGGIIWLTLGSIFTGVLEIYGTTNKLTLVFWLVGTALTLLGFLGMEYEKYRPTDS